MHMRVPLRMTCAALSSRSSSIARLDLSTPYATPNRSFAAGALKSVYPTDTSKISDITIQITFINPKGERLTVPGLCGRSLLTCAQMNGLGLKSEDKGGGASWAEGYGEGVSDTSDHVVLAKEYFSLALPDTLEEIEALEARPNCTSTSRLASQLILTKDLDGMAVYIPPDNECYDDYV